MRSDDRDGAHRLRAVGERLGHREHIGRHAEALRGEIRAGASEPRDHLIENEQDAVLVADVAQPLQIALGRHEAAGGTRDGLDEARGDVLRAEEVDETHEVLGQFHAVRAFALREAVRGQERMAHVRDARERGTELAAIVDHPGQRYAAEIDAVIGALARDEHRASALAARLVIRERHLHRGVDGFGAGVGEEDPVEIARRELGHTRCQLELLRMATGEWRDEIELPQLCAHCVGDFPAPVAGGAAEEAGCAVDDLVATVIPVVHPLRAYDHLGVVLEIAVRRERHPVFVERDALRRGVPAQREFGMVHCDFPGKRAAIGA